MLSNDVENFEMRKIIQRGLERKIDITKKRFKYMAKFRKHEIQSFNKTISEFQFSYKMKQKNVFAYLSVCFYDCQ